MGSCTMKWLGHSTIFFTTPEGKRFIIDPWLEANPTTPAKEKKPPEVDAVLITHGHSDHISDAITLARRYKPDIVAIFEIAAWLSRKGVENTKPMNKGGTQTVGGCEVSMVHAIHSNSMQDEGNMVYGGEACGFVIRIPDGPTIYHAGDTDVFSDMQLIHELYAPQVVCLPVGDHYTMGAKGAALAVGFLQPEKILPLHFGTFPVLCSNLDAFRSQLAPEFQDRIIEVKPGEEFEIG
jgi:L-ascorbate metabolism protein UlaG (beta-lactamase superfamily)